MEESKKIKCDVLGLCETRRKEELNARWNDGSAVRLGKGDGTRTIGGIGFIVSKEWASKIVSCNILSSRIGVLNVQVSGKATLKIIQAYAPTNSVDDDEVEEFYQELETALTKKSTYTIVMGDFNAKPIQKKTSEKMDMDSSECSVPKRNRLHHDRQKATTSRRLCRGSLQHRQRPSFSSGENRHRQEKREESAAYLNETPTHQGLRRDGIARRHRERKLGSD
ncbi:unnamed protein product [Anisakis simplex]|uniref:Endo/exonuclease/phosphatase domain-containing protein n=1 Tax=Anisakis simplex TaxID=6269 RepID=A0A0M3JUX7_ANISI|nr:unnamed protein product [Anisakis simplex]